MVPKQTGEDQEGVGPKEPAGAAADGTRTIQSLDDSADKGGGGIGGDAREQALIEPELDEFSRIRFIEFRW